MNTFENPNSTRALIITSSDIDESTLRQQVGSNFRLLGTIPATMATSTSSTTVTTMSPLLSSSLVSSSSSSPPPSLPPSSSYLNTIRQNESNVVIDLSRSDCIDDTYNNYDDAIDASDTKCALTKYISDGWSSVRPHCKYFGNIVLWVGLQLFRIMIVALITLGLFCIVLPNWFIVDTSSMYIHVIGPRS
uniref:ORF10 n=1 Tax=Kallithea virus TaxID=1654582 RepID=A0A0F7KMX7_9VIRU|nr:ORF10 [Kallithea virus]